MSKLRQPGVKRLLLRVLRLLIGRIRDLNPGHFDCKALVIFSVCSPGTADPPVEADSRLQCICTDLGGIIHGTSLPGLHLLNYRISVCGARNLPGDDWLLRITTAHPTITEGKSQWMEF